MKKSIISLIGLVLLALVALLFFMNNSSDGVDDETAQDQDVDIKELVHEHSLHGIPGEVAIITGTELIVEDSDGSETVYSLPDDEFFVSIAPYIDVTHP